MKVLTNFALVFCFFVIALGAATRLMDAGLGCPDWPLCYGKLLVPASAAEIENFAVATFDETKAWTEVLHRMAASVLGFAVFLLLFLDVRNSLRRKKRISRLLLLLSLVVVLQAAFGMWTVTLRLLPQVVVTHLLGGFLLLALIFIHFLNLNRTYPSPSAPVPAPLLYITYIGFALLIAQIALGGWVSANYAALACVDFPLCQGSWFPPADFAQGFNFFHPLGPNYEGGVLDAPSRLAVHLTHRFGAALVFLYWSGYYFSVRLSAPQFCATLNWLFLILLGQLALGITNVLAELPLLIAVAHNITAALLLLSVIALLHHIHYGRRVL